MTSADLDDIVKTARGQRCSVAHIQGPHGSGKSTEIIPRLWSLVEDDPEFRMFYIQPTVAQTALLQDSLAASEDTKIKAALDNGRFKLRSIKSAVRKMLRINKQEDLGHKIVMCVDLEVVPTAFGEFLFACLLDLAVQAHDHGNADTSYILVTVSSTGHRYPATPSRLPAPATIMVPDAVILPDIINITYKRSLTRVGREILAMLGDDGIVLVFLDVDEYTMLSDLLDLQKLNIRTVHVRDTTLGDPTLSRALFNIKGPAFLQLDTDIPAVTLPFRNVRAVISGSAKRTRLLDGPTGLYLQAIVRKGQPELDTHQAHVRTPEGGVPPVLAIVDFNEKEDVPRPPVSLAYDAEVIPLALLAFYKWAHLPIDKMPIAYIVDCPKSKYKEAVFRLQAMDMLKSNRNAGQPQQLSILGRHAVNVLTYVVNWRVAVFLGHMSADMTPTEQRVFIRLAVLIDIGMPVELASMSRKVMRDIVNNVACGPAASMVRYGQPWVALSMWERFRQIENDFAETADTACYVNGEVVLHNAVAVHSQILKLEHMIKLQPATEEEMSKVLGDGALLNIDNALVDAWVTNVIWIPQNWSQTEPDTFLARCAAHGDEIVVNDTKEAIFLEGLLDDGGVWAVALDIFKHTDRLQAWNLILIDGRAVTRIKMKMGAASEREALLSMWAHRARS